MQFKLFFLFLALPSTFILVAMEPSAKSKTRGPSQYSKEIQAAPAPLSGTELEKHLAASKQAYEQRKEFFSIPTSADIQQLQEAQNLVLHPQNAEIDYARAKEILQKLITHTRANEIKAEALYLRGIMEFNGVGQPVNFKKAILDFQKVLDLPEPLEIKSQAQIFKLVSQRMFEIKEAIDFATTYEDALLEVKVIADEIPSDHLNAILLEKILKIFKTKFPIINLVNTAMRLDLPHIESLIQELIAKDPEYARDGNQIIEQSLINNNRESFFKFFKIPALAYHVLTTLDVLIRATKNADYIILAMLIDAGVNLNYVNQQGENPLSIAITMGNPRLVQWLLEHGADPFYQFIVNQRLTTPMVIAHMQEYPHKQEILQILPQIFSQPNQPPQELLEEPTHSESTVEPTESEQLSQKIKDDAQKAYQVARRPLFSLKQKRKTKTVVSEHDLPLRAPKDIKISVTPEEKKIIEQHSLAAYQSSKKPMMVENLLVSAARDSDIKALTKLINAGADINQVSGRGQKAENALSVAVKKDDILLVEWLLNHGASPTMRLNTRNDTPYTIALRLNNPHSSQIINRLLIAITGFQAPAAAKDNND